MKTILQHIKWCLALSLFVLLGCTEDITDGVFSTYVLHYVEEDYYLTGISDKTIYASAESGSETISFQTNSRWDLERDSNWITVSPSWGWSSETVTLSWEANTSTEERTAKITLTTSTNCGSAVITIVQAGAWVSLGIGKFKDSRWFDNWYECEIQQYSSNANQFRIIDPYSAALEAEGYQDNSYFSNSTPCEYIEFYIAEVGQTAYGITFTQEDLVYYKDFAIGVHQIEYDEDIYGLFPGRMVKYTSSEKSCLYNKVLLYQDNGLPSTVQLAPYYHMFNVQRGWDCTQEDNIITIVFPGCTAVPTEIDGNGVGRNEPETDIELF